MEKPVFVSQEFKVSRPTLWKAITEWDQMTQWFFENITDFIPEVGFKTRFVVENEERVFPHLWKITEVKPYERITYDWRYEGYEGRSLVVFELKEMDHGLELTVTYQIIEPFDQSIPEFTRESCEGGWQYFINQRLVKYIGSIGKD